MAGVGLVVREGPEYSLLLGSCPNLFRWIQLELTQACTRGIQALPGLGKTAQTPQRVA